MAALSFLCDGNGGYLSTSTWFSRLDTKVDQISNIQSQHTLEAMGRWDHVPCDALLGCVCTNGYRYSSRQGGSDGTHPYAAACLLERSINRPNGFEFLFEGLRHNVSRIWSIDDIDKVGSRRRRTSRDPPGGH